jgi:predicted Rossmann-fold nucleotide-binding protein
LGPSIGLNIALPHEQRPNSYVSKELAFSVHYFAIRKLHFLLRARALVAFLGGIGTLDEIFETLTLVQTGTIEPLPVILVGEEFWRQAFDPDFLVREGAISSQDRQLFCYAESAEEIWEEICSWHLKSGKFLLCESEKFDNRAT